VAVEVTVRPPAQPLVEGMPDLVEVAVRAPADRAVLLDEISFVGALGRTSLRRRPNGLMLYDAQSDRYALLTVTQAVSSVPIHTRVLPPQCGTNALVQIRVLTPGKKRVTVVVEYREVQADELPDRLYLSRAGAGIRTSPYIFKLARERTADVAKMPPTDAIVRESGLEPLVWKTEVELEVAPDAGSPGRVAAERGELIGRCHALGGAWLVAAPEGGVLAAFADRTVHVDANLAVFEALDELRGDSLRALFRGGRASKVCEELLGETGDTIPALVPPEKLRALLELAARGGVRLRVGRPWEGVVVDAP
jgi:hypothetical protein